VRSYPGEWAKFDGYVHSTLAVTLPAVTSFSTGTIVFTSDPGFNEGAGVIIDQERVVLYGKQADHVTWNNCFRAATPIGVAGVGAVHLIGTSAYNSDPVLTLDGGSYTTFRDFEILDSYPTRAYNFNWGNTSFPIRSTGIIVQNNAGTKLVNLVIHDTSIGVYANEGAIALEIYGVIVFNNGFVDWSRGHGQGFYLANNFFQWL
jgi:hypothetical protein